MKSIELEKALLGCLITDGKYIDSVKQYIPEDDFFYSSFNQKVWKALDKLNKNNKKIIFCATDSFLAMVSKNKITKMNSTQA